MSQPRDIETCGICGLPALTTRLTDEQISERAEIVMDSDAVCLGCGADPRALDIAAAADPEWHIDAILYPGIAKGTFHSHADIMCPKCLSGPQEAK